MELNTPDLKLRHRPASVTEPGDFLLDVLSTTNFSDTLSSFALQIRLAIGAHQCWISYLPQGELKAAVHRHSFSDKYVQFDSPNLHSVEYAIWDLVLREKKSLRLNAQELTRHPMCRSLSGPAQAHNPDYFQMRGCLAAPVLTATGQVLGIVLLSDRFEDAEFSASDLGLLEHLTHLVSPTFLMQNARIELAKRTDAVRAATAVTTSEEMLRLIMDNIPQGVFWKDRQSRYLGCNQVVARAFGLASPAIIAGQDDKHLPGLTREQAEHFIAHDRVVMENNRAEFGIIERATLADGKTIWMETNKIPMQDAAGSVVGVLGTWQDITERKRAEDALEESEERFRAVVDHAADGIFIHTSSGVILDANRAACESLGYARHELAGMRLVEIDPDFTQDKLESLRAPLKTGEKVTLVTVHRRKDGTTFPVEIRFGALPMGGGNYGLSIARDITERTRAEEQIRTTSTFRETIIRIAAEGICVCFPIQDYPYVSFSVWNDQMTEITGYTMEEINCLGWYQTVYPDVLVREQAIARMARMRAGDDMRGEEWEITRKDGQRRTVAISTSRAELAGNSEAVVAIMQDVSERKKSEAALRQRLQELTLLSRVGEICTSSHTEDELFYRVTRAIAEQLYPDNCGFLLLDPEMQMLVTHPSFVLSDPTVSREDKPLGMGIVGQVAQLGRPKRIGDVSQESGYIAADSRTRSELCIPLRLGSSVLGVLNIESQELNRFSDADEQLMSTVIDLVGNALGRLRGERELRESEERYRSILEGLPVGVFVHDNSRIRYANPKALQIMGADCLEDLTRVDPLELVAPEFREMASDRIATIMRTGKSLPPVEAAVIRLDGIRVQVEINHQLTRFEGNACLQVLFHDITVRKRAEEALRESEERLRAVIDYSPGVAVQWYDREGRVVLWNSASETMFGFSASEAVGKTLDQLIHTPEEYRVFVETLATIVQSENSISPSEYTFKRRNGESGVCLSTLFRIPGPNESDWFVCMDVDITERKQAELALRESEDRFREVVEAVPVSLLMVDEAGKIILLNEQTEKTFGYSRGDLLGQSIELLVPHSSRHQHSEHRTSFLANPRHRIMGRDGDLAGIRKDGNEFPAEVRLAPLPTGEGMHVLAAVVDITARKRAEEERLKLESQIRHAQKLESLGVLAGGIAHDFNNLLTGILGYAELARLELPANSTALGHINEAVKGALRAAELTQRMLAYAGKGRLQIQPLNLSAVIAEMGRLLEISISKKCILQYHFAPNLPACLADGAQLRQVIMNLIINASEAIGDQSGVISVSTSVQECDRESLSDAYLDDKLPEGRYVCLEVSDTGCGMSEETRTKLFDPFFTTKFTGRGLGLAAVLGIVRGHRGAIKVESVLGKGTSFKVLFPASASPAQLEPAQTRDASAWRGDGLVLIVDDEESVRGLTRRMLESMGFTVLTAADGREAVEIFRQENSRIRLVILDMTMPHLDGRQTFREMQLIRSGVPTVLCSGYNEQTATDLFGGTSIAAFIQKPFQYQHLAAAVHKALQINAVSNTFRSSVGEFSE